MGVEKQRLNEARIELSEEYEMGKFGGPANKKETWYSTHLSRLSTARKTRNSSTMRSMFAHEPRRALQVSLTHTFLIMKDTTSRRCGLNMDFPRLSKRLTGVTLVWHHHPPDELLCVQCSLLMCCFSK